MLLKSTTEQADARAKTILVNGESYILRGYVGMSPARGTYVEGNEVNDNDLPQGFLVYQPPHAVTRPHFHETDQFQVFVGGSGRLGKKSANPLSVQFAGGHTPYGPIFAGDEGVTYFTLRQRWDPGAKYMPAMRDRLVRGRQRQRFALEVERGAEADLLGLAAPLTRELIPAEADGLFAALYELGAGQRMRLPDPRAGGGQYLVVTEGALIDDGELMSRWSCLFVPASESSYEAVAGSAGLALLVLRFPKPKS